MKLLSLFSQRLYLRIWLAVVGGVAVLTLTVAWAWQIAAEQNAQNVQSASSPPSRDVAMRDGQGNVIAQGRARRLPGPPEEGLRFEIEGTDGQTYMLHMAPRPPRGDRPPHDGAAAFWLRPPFGFLWLLGLVGVAVAVGVFPIIRRLLKRLENLQRGVKRFGEGDLSVRVPEHGSDEVADLAHQFNAAAARIETLVTSHKSLLANASHELRSPLTRIRMGLEFMGDDPASARARAALAASRTTSRTVSPAVTIRSTCGSVRSRVASSALRRRLMITCSSRMRSAITITRWRGKVRVICTTRCFSCGSIIASAEERQARRSTGSNASPPLRA